MESIIIHIYVHTGSILGTCIVLCFCSCAVPHSSIIFPNAVFNLPFCLRVLNLAKLAIGLIFTKIVPAACDAQTRTGWVYYLDNTTLCTSDSRDGSIIVL